MSKEQLERQADRADNLADQTVDEEVKETSGPRQRNIGRRRSWRIEREVKRRSAFLPWQHICC